MNPDTKSATQRIGDPCEHCNGKGILTQDGPTCPKCNGVGLIYPEAAGADINAQPVYRPIPRERVHAKRGIGFTSKNKEESKSRRKMAKASRKKNR
jgi:RecJ-like exonuclease